MKVGDIVVVKEGASDWMKNHNYWMAYMGESIDGRVGRITEDNTHLNGNDSHFSVDFGLEYEVGVNQDWLMA